MQIIMQCKTAKLSASKYIHVYETYLLFTQHTCTSLTHLFTNLGSVLVSICNVECDGHVCDVVGDVYCLLGCVWRSDC